MQFRVPLIASLLVLLTYSCSQNPPLDATAYTWEISDRTLPDTTLGDKSGLIGFSSFQFEEDSMAIHYDFIGEAVKHRAIPQLARTEADTGRYWTYEAYPDSSLALRFYVNDSLQFKEELTIRTDFDTGLSLSEIEGQSMLIPLGTRDTIIVYIDKRDPGEDDDFLRPYYARVEQPIQYPLKSKVTAEKNYNEHYFYLFGSPEQPRIRGYLHRKDKSKLARAFYGKFIRDAQGQMIFETLEAHGSRERNAKQYPMAKFPSLVPEEVADLTIVRRLNEGRIVLDLDYRLDDDAAIDFDSEDTFFKRKGGLRHRELNQLGFEFSEDGKYSIFTNDRELETGRWKFSGDRRYLLLDENSNGRVFPLAIAEYTDDYIGFILPLNVQTPRPRGEMLLSHYPLKLHVRVYEQTAVGK